MGSAHEPKFIQLAMDVVDVAFMRMEPGCRELPGEFLLILARVVFDGYEIFPDPASGKTKRGPRAGSEVD